MTDPHRPDAPGAPGWSPWAPRQPGQRNPSVPTRPTSSPSSPSPWTAPAAPRPSTAPAEPAPWTSAPTMPSTPPVRPVPQFAPAQPSFGPGPGGPPVFGPPPAAPTPEPPPSAASNGRTVSALIGAVVGAIVAALVAGIVVAQAGDPSPRAVSATSAPSSGATASSGRGGRLDVRAVLAEAEPSVVSVQTNLGEGSGFVLSADGYVVTNYHVIEGATSLRVRFQGGQTTSAQMIGSFPDNDLALIKVSDQDDLVPARLGRSSALQVGDDVLAIGNALGLGAAPSVTLGIVSATDRKVPIDGAVLDHLIQTDAAINHGNSGGPLVNSAGEVVGVNTLVAEGAQSIGFAIAIDSLKPLIEDLKAGRGQITPNTAFIGVSTVAIDDPSVDPAELRAKGITSTFGALVVEIKAGSPADQAGIQVDDVIVELDGTEIRSSDAIGKVVREHKVGDRITVVYERAGRRATVQVTLARRGG